MASTTRQDFRENFGCRLPTARFSFHLRCHSKTHNQRSTINIEAAIIYSNNANYGQVNDGFRSSRTLDQSGALAQARVCPRSNTCPREHYSRSRLLPIHPTCQFLILAMSSHFARTIQPNDRKAPSHRPLTMLMIICPMPCRITAKLVDD